METVKEYLKRVADAVRKHPKHKPFDEAGNFLPDPQPIAPPIGYVQEESMFDRVRNLVRRELSQVAASQDFETFEESDDFDVDDDRSEFLSPYEMILEQAVPDGRVINPDPDQGGETPPDPQPPPGSKSSKSGDTPGGGGAPDQNDPDPQPPPNVK